MSDLKLYSLTGCPYCLRVMYVLEALQLPYQLVHFTKTEQMKTDEYLKINPKGEAPSLETPQGIIYESAAIMRYLAGLRPELGLNGRNFFEASQIEIWMVNSAPLGGSVGGILIQLIGKIGHNAASLAGALENVHKQFAMYNEYLSARTYLVTHQVTLADYALLPFLNIAFQYILEEKERLSYPNVYRYWKNLTASTVHTHLMGEKRKLATKLFKIPASIESVNQAPAPAQVKAKPAAEQNPKTSATPAAKPKQASQQAPTPKPAAAAKPAEEAAPKDDPAAAAASVYLYNFKTTFTNAADKIAATEELLNTYNKEQFSFWFGQYDKHPSEGKEMIATNNLLTNFVSRVTDVGASKNLLAVYGIYGDEPNLNLQGVWFWRGLTHLKEMQAHPVNEFVKWEKLDPANPTDRARITAYWSQTKSEEGTVEGNKVRTVKIVK
jgi:glutathione S-transferase